MKKKLAGVLVCIMVMLVSASAEDLEDYFRGYAALESNYGAYDAQWPLEAKTQMVRLMLEQSMITLDQEEVGSLFFDDLTEDEKNALASKIIEAYYKDAMAMNTFNIMLNELGQMEDWPYEAKALYSSLLVEQGKQKQSWDLYLLPTHEDISFEEAEAIAIDTLCEKFSVTRDALLAANVHASFYQKGGDVPDDTEPVWLIAFDDIVHGDGLYYVELSRRGEVLMYKAPNTQLLYDSDDLLAKATPATPGEHDAGAAQVMEDARYLLVEKGWCSEQEAEAMQAEAHFIYHEHFCLGYEPVWLVYLYAEDALQYKGLFGYDGSLIDIVSGEKEFDMSIRKGFYIEEELGVQFMSFDFWGMTHEQRAEFSSKWNPIVDAYLQEHPYYKNHKDWLVDVTRHTYGIPDEMDISEEEARDAARQAIIALGADLDTVGSRPIECYFDITDPNQHKWNLFISQPKNYEDFICYRVVLDAKTGSVLDAFEIIAPMIPADYRM